MDGDFIIVLTSTTAPDGSHNAYFSQQPNNSAGMFYDEHRVTYDIDSASFSTPYPGTMMTGSNEWQPLLLSTGEIGDRADPIVM